MDQLLTELNKRGIRFELEGDQLRTQAPKGTLSDELRQSIAENEDGLVTMLRSVAHQTALPPIVARPEERYEPFPLLELQYASWIGRQSLVESGGVASHQYSEYEKVGLDVDRLNESLQKVIAQHDMLRAIITPDGSQRILKEVPPYRIATTDARGRSSSEQEAALLAVRERMSHQVLPSDRWPIFEFHAVLLDEDRVRLCVSLDLLILDGRSMQMFLDECARQYNDPAYAPAPLELTYRDYVLTEKVLQESEVFKRDEKYWLDRLDTLPPAPELALAKTLDPSEEPRFSTYAGTVPKPQWERLKAKAAGYGASPVVFLMACFSEVLRRWVREPRFTLNLTLFDRPAVHPQVDDIMGDFTTINLLEMQARPGESFAARLSCAQQQLDQNRAHAHFSGLRFMRERMRRHGQLGADMPIVLTSVLPPPGKDALGNETRNLFGEETYGTGQTPQVWLDHQVAEDNGELGFHWNVVEDLFAPGMVADMFESYTRLLERLVDDEALWQQAGCLAELPRWQAELLAGVNATEADIPPTTLHELVAAQARRRPDALAVVSDTGRLTYGELSAHANRLGRYLRSLGASKNRLVVIAMERGWEQVAGVLGILHSGAAYLPIDPNLPQQRRWDLLARGETQLVVTQLHLRHLAWPNGTTVITLDDAEVRASDPGPIEFVQAPEDLAYVLFTSGSTGEPKGAMLHHHGAANTVQDINRRFNVNENDRVLALSSLSFDLSVYDIFGVLGAGGTVVMPLARSVHDPVHWNRLLDQHRVTLWNSVPQLLQLWVENVQSRRIKAGRFLRHVQLSGDWIPVKLPDQARAVCPQVQVASLGGPTEASIWQAGYPIGAVDPNWKSIPYGRPLANQRLYICNSLMEPRAVWATGEIHIGGAGVGRGYWRDEARTAERFVHHPQTGERLYKSGDLGRYLPDGSIEFLGREDFQVKINGHRIELGEIEATLRRQPGVREALTTVSASGEGGQKQLVAYVVPAPDEHNPLFSEESVAAPEGFAERRQLLADVLELSLQDHEMLSAAPLRMFDTAWTEMERIAIDAMARSLSQLGLFQRVGETQSVDGIIERCGLDDKRRPLIRLWLDVLAKQGRLQQAGASEYRCEAPFVTDELARRIKSATEVLPPEVRSCSSLFLQCVDEQIDLLRGGRSIFDLMRREGAEGVAQLENAENPVATVHHKVVADAVQAIFERLPSEASVNILEIGTGVSGATASLLPLLPVNRTRYVLTSVSSLFLDSAKRRFGRFGFVEYAELDANRSPREQGFVLHSFDVIIARNALSMIAQDLPKSLGYLRSLLTPAGTLLLTEETRNSPVHAVTLGFFDGFGLYADDRRDSGLPFCSLVRWQEQLDGAGFQHVRVTPAFSLLNHGTRPHVFAAEAPPRVRRFQPDLLRDALASSLPEYMVPRHYLLLERLPLSPNGKVDLKALPLPWAGAEKKSAPVIAPRSDTERRLRGLWVEVLGRDGFGIEASFFDLGGESMNAMTLSNRMRAEFNLEVEQAVIMQQLFGNATVAALAEFIEKRAAAA